MLFGAVSRNAEQASSIGVFAGMALGALGGCMVPLAFMPDAMQTFAKLIPHSWAITALQSLIRDGGGIETIAPNLVVLAGYVVVLMGLASWRFRKAAEGGCHGRADHWTASRRPDMLHDMLNIYLS